MRTTTWARRLALLLVIGLFAAACGGSEETDGEGTEAAGDSSSEMSSEMSSEGDSGEPAAQNEGDGTLHIGSMLPQTGDLAFLGPPEFAGVGLAIEDINAAGGVLDNDVLYTEGDSGDTTTDIASQTVDRLLQEGVDAIIGAASSGVSLTVIDKITGANVIHFSPANTSDQFTDYDDRGLYFRTAPPDVLQGRILGQLVLDDGAATVAILARQDPYGEGLANNAESVITESGGDVVLKSIYDPNLGNFDAQVQEIVGADPDAIIVIGFDETKQILQTMIEQGVGPQDKPVYGTDGNMGNSLVLDENDEPIQALVDNIAGMRGTLPGADIEGSDFKTRLDEFDTELNDYSYAAESYDAVVTVALAAVAAGSDNPSDIAAEIPAVTAEGTACTSFSECRDLLDQGEDIDYDGQSGPIELNEVGDPTTANFQILEFGEDGTVSVAEIKEASLE